MRHTISKSRHTDSALIVSAAQVSLLRDYLQARGLDPEPLIGPSLPADAVVSPERWQTMLQQSAAAVDEPAFGLAMARHVSVRHFGIVGYLASSCGTLQEGLQRGVRYAALVAEMNPTQMEIRDGQLQLSWPLQNGWSGQLWDELGMGMIVSIIRLVLHTGFAATRVDFVGAAPHDTDVYERFFGCKVYFSQAMPRLSFSSHYLDMPLPDADTGLLALLDAQAEEKLQKLVPLTGELQQFRLHLLQLIRARKTRLEDLAAYNNLSARTLQRRFKLLGSNFQTLLDETRHHLAEQYLADARLELHEVADLLGYSEQSSFTRAFQQWTGKTPGQWRRKIKQDNQIAR